VRKASSVSGSGSFIGSLVLSILEQSDQSIHQLWIHQPFGVFSVLIHQIFHDADIQKYPVV
jgi:hypothetical protein